MKKKILIVEDEIVAATECSHIVASHGYMVIGVVQTGEQAVEIATDAKPDLIIMDIVLPGEMDGITASERISAEMDIPIIFLTASSDEPTMKRALELKPYAYIVKPFDHANLITCIEIAFSKHEILKVLELEIKERKKAEDNLRESDRELKIRAELLHVASDLILLLDLQGNILYTNESVCRELGYTENEILTMNIRDLESSDYAAAVYDRIDALYHNESAIFESVLCGRKGNVIPVEIHARIIERKGEKMILSSARVIFERKKEEEHLLMYEIIMNTVQDPLAVVSRDYLYIAANNAYCVFFQKSIDDIVGHPVSEMLGEDMFNTFVKERLNAAFSGKIISLNRWFSLKGKAMQYLDIHYIPYQDTCGNITGVVVSIRDITEVKSASEKIERQQLELDTIFNISTPLCLIDTNYTISRVNDTFCSLLGVTWEDVVGKPCSKVLGHAMCDTGDCLLNRVQDTKDECRGEADIQLTDGTILHIIKTARPLFDTAGKVTGILETVIDITERRRMEVALKRSVERYQYLVENLNDIIFRMNKNGIVTYLNPTVMAVLGYSPNEINGKGFHEFVHPDDLGIIISFFRDVLDNKLYPSEYRMIRNDGSICWVRSSCRAIKEDGIITGIQGIIVDISERKEVENRYVEKNVYLEILNAIAVRATVFSERNKSYEEFLCDELKMLCDAFFAALSRFDPDTKNLTVKYVRTNSDVRKKIKEILGVDIKGVTFPFEEKDAEWVKKHQIKRLEGIHELTFGVIPETVSKKIEQELNIGSIYGIGLMIGEDIAGTMVFFLKPGQAPPPQDIIEAFANLAKVSILRNESESLVRLSEEKYRIISENIPVIVYSALPDDKSTSLLITGQIEEVTGYSDKELRERPDIFNEIIYEDDREYVQKIKEENRRNKTILDVEYRIVAKDKTIKWIHDRAKPFLNSRGNILQINGYREDITDRKNLEKEMAEATERDRYRISLDLHDGLGQQLAGINMLLGVLEKKLLMGKEIKPGELREISKLAAYSIDITKRIARGLLPVTLMEGGFVSALKELADTTSIISGVPCSVRYTRGIVILDRSVEMQLYYVAREAVSNAVKYGGKKEINVSLSLKKSVLTMEICNDRSSKRGNGEGKGMGLKIMQYRSSLIGADFWAGCTDRGFIVTVKVPIENKAEDLD